MLRKKRQGATVPEFPKIEPGDQVKAVSVRLKSSLWERLKKIGQEQTPKRSMNEVVSFFLEWAADDYELAKARKKKP